MVKQGAAPETTVEVAVIGAGLAGLATGLAFARRGVAVEIVGPRDRLGGGRTVALLDPSVNFLEKLGVADALRAGGSPLQRLRMVDDAGGLFRAPTVDFSARELGLAAFGWNVENAALAETLEAAALSHPLVRRRQTSVKAFRVEGGAMLVETAEGQPIRARLLVGADGVGSFARRAAGIDETMLDYHQAALTGLFAHERPHAGLSVEFHKRGGPFTLVPLPPGAGGDHRSSLVWAVPDAEADRLAALSDDEWARAVEDEAHWIFGSMRLVSGRGRAPLRRLAAKRFVGERLALVGEAAHALPPIGAQGFNLSLRDVAALVDASLEAGALGSAESLGAYESGRKADAAWRTAAVDALNRSLLRSFLPADAARAAGLGVISAFAPAKRAAMRLGLGA